MFDSIAGYSDKFIELAAGWNEIEGRLKEAEQINDDAIIPAINELRYAGRRLVDIMELTTKVGVAPNVELLDEHVHAVRIYFKNAKHDIVDALTAHIGRRMKFVMRKYPLSDIEKLAPGFIPMKDEIFRIEKLTAISRADRSRRAEIYDEIGDHVLPKVINFSLGDLHKAEMAFVMLDRQVRIKAYVMVFIFMALAVACGMAAYNALPHSDLWVTVIGVVGSLASIISISLQLKQLSDFLPASWRDERDRG